MNNMGTMAELIEAAMKKKQGGKETFTMVGQYASPVMYEEETSREYVMYEAPNGEQVKVYGTWNEYAVAVDDEGRDLIEDADYPVMMNADGEYVLDMKSFESGREEAPQGAPGMEDSFEQMQSEGAEEEMMEEEGMMFGGKMKYANGGKLNSGSPDQGDPDSEKAKQEYFEFKKYLERARQAIGTNDKEELKALGSLREPYNVYDLTKDYKEAQRLRKAAGLGIKEEADLLFPHIGQQMRGTMNEILGTNFRSGGFMRPIKRR